MTTVEQELQNCWEMRMAQPQYEYFDDVSGRSTRIQTIAARPVVFIFEMELFGYIPTGYDAFAKIAADPDALIALFVDYAGPWNPRYVPALAKLENLRSEYHKELGRKVLKPIAKPLPATRRLILGRNRKEKQ